MNDEHRSMKRWLHPSYMPGWWFVTSAVLGGLLLSALLIVLGG